MPPIKGAFRNYSEKAMKATIEDVKLRREVRKKRKELKKLKACQPKRKKTKKVLQCSSESSDTSCEIPECVHSEHNEEPTEENMLERKEILDSNKSVAVKKDVNEHKHGQLCIWPETPDRLDYEWEDILFHINDPTKASKT